MSALRGILQVPRSSVRNINSKRNQTPCSRTGSRASSGCSPNLTLKPELSACGIDSLTCQTFPAALNKAHSSIEAYSSFSSLDHQEQIEDILQTSRISRCFSPLCSSNSRSTVPLWSSFNHHSSLPLLSVQPLLLMTPSTRLVSTQPPEKPKSFMEGVFFDIKEELRKNKEMKENLKKFREEAKKLEESEQLKQAREKFSKVLDKDSVFKEKLDELKESDFVKKTSNAAEEIGSKTSETVAETVKTISESEAFKKVSEGVTKAKDAVQEELNESSIYVRGQVYRPPPKLQKRSDRLLSSVVEEKTFEANESATEIVMHKDSKFAASWQNFKDNNQYVNKMFEYKMKYDESDHVAVRMSRAVTEKMSSLFGGLFTKTEMSDVLTEICKMDPSFDPIAFSKQCREDIIPNILEAIIHGNIEILEDWCHEAAFNQLATPMRQAVEQKLRFDSRVLDISDVEIVAGKLMEQGPVLVITFSAQQIMTLRNKSGDIVEGDPDKILRVTYVWALCRDQSIFDPSACWRLIDLSASSATQWL